MEQTRRAITSQALAALLRKHFKITREASAAEKKLRGYQQSAFQQAANKIAPCLNVPPPASEINSENAPGAAPHKMAKSPNQEHHPAEKPRRQSSKHLHDEQAVTILASLGSVFLEGWRIACGKIKIGSCK